jgi:hypothetical protein
MSRSCRWRSPGGLPTRYPATSSHRLPPQWRSRGAIPLAVLAVPEEEVRRGRRSRSTSSPRSSSRPSRSWRSRRRAPSAHSARPRRTSRTSCWIRWAVETGATSDSGDEQRRARRPAPPRARSVVRPLRQVPSTRSQTSTAGARAFYPRRPHPPRASQRRLSRRFCWRACCARWLEPILRVATFDAFVTRFPPRGFTAVRPPRFPFGAIFPPEWCGSVNSMLDRGERQHPAQTSLTHP